MDLGFDAAGIETLWQCEIDAKPRSVLAKHWPDAVRYTDVKTVKGADVKPVDIMTFVSPCQYLSVAVKRAGLAGKRSGLYHEAIRVIKEMRDATQNQYPRVAIWENVRGAFSSNDGADFHTALQALANIGAVDISWRLVNACNFGVPQRRMRVFVVATFGEERAGEVLSKPTRLLWHPPQSTEAGQETTGEVEDSAGIDSLDFDHGVSPTITSKWHKGNAGPAGDEVQNLVTYVKSKRAQNVDDYETWITDVPAPTLNLIDNTCDAFATVAIAYDGYNNKVSSTVHTTLRTGKDSGDGIFIPVDKSYKVRRLTPRECERLMGWPDDHTRYDDKGNELSDTARYKMCGNGIASPVAQWLGENIVEAYNA